MSRFIYGTCHHFASKCLWINLNLEVNHHRTEDLRIMIDDGNQSMMVQSRKHYPTVIEDLKLGMLVGQVILHTVGESASHSLDWVN